MNTRDKINKLLEICPNYEKVNTYEFLEGDDVSETLVNFYVDLIDKIDMDDKEQVEFLSDLDSSLSKYVDNYSFRRTLKKEVSKISPKEKYYAFKITKQLMEKATRIDSSLVEETVWI